ncbi:probable LRR receptor-like serine/threonine-protein kinase isoform X2 [Tanacetum coccineum]
MSYVVDWFKWTRVVLVASLHSAHEQTRGRWLARAAQLSQDFTFHSKLSICQYLSGESLRFQIKLRVALDSAKGILYVHTKAKPPVFHGDIKTRNILTDSELTAKVADFELLRPAPILGDYGVGPNYVSTDVRGTPISWFPSYFLAEEPWCMD